MATNIPFIRHRAILGALLLVSGVPAGISIARSMTRGKPDADHPAFLVATMPTESGDENVSNGGRR
jgi:hypothetical protein